MSSTSPTQLGTVITDPRTRKAIYTAFIVATVISGAITVGFATVGPLPQWDIVLNSVLAFLGAPVATLAVANTRTPADTPNAIAPPADPEL